MFITVLNQMLALAVLVIAGIWLYQKKFLDDHSTTKISAMITHLFNPMLMVSSAMDSIGKVDKKSWFTVLFIVFVIFIILILLSFPAIRFFEKEPGKKELFQLTLIFGNLGFMGIPVVSGVYGEAYAVYVLAFIIGFNFFFYTFVLTLLDRKFNLKALKGMLNPGTLACFLAIFLLLIEPSLPVFVTSPIKWLGNLCSPLAMLILGQSVARSDLKKIFTSPGLYLFTAYRMILLPLLAIPILKLLPLDEIVRGVCLIEISMPVANLVLTTGLEKKIDCDQVSAAIIMTTILSVFTLPVIVSLL